MNIVLYYACDVFYFISPDSQTVLTAFSTVWQSSETHCTAVTYVTLVSVCVYMWTVCVHVDHKNKVIVVTALNDFN